MSDTQEQQGLDIEAIEKRANAATPGPWAHLHGYDGDGEEYRFIGFERDPLDRWWGKDSSLPNEADAEFIARSREDIPALIARVRELEDALRPLTYIEPAEDELAAIEGLLCDFTPWVHALVPLWPLWEAQRLLSNQPSQSPEQPE